MFENPRRGRQARNFTTNIPKIFDLKSSSEQIFFRKLSLGAPENLMEQVIYREYMVSHILNSRSNSASVIPWRYTVLTLYLTTATTLRTSKLSILLTNTTVTSWTKFNLRCEKWMKNERKEVIWPTPTLSQDGYLMAFRPKIFARSLQKMRH